jgi:hypothetical protein
MGVEGSGDYRMKSTFGDILIGHFEDAERRDVDLHEYVYEILKERVYDFPALDPDFAKHFSKGNLVVMPKNVHFN